MCLSFPLSITTVKHARSIVSSIGPCALVSGAVREDVSACSAAQSMVPPAIVLVAIAILLTTLPMPAAIFPLPFISKHVSGNVHARAILLAILPLTYVPAAIRPGLVSGTMELICLELAYVLGASIRAMQGTLATPLVELELALVVGGGVINLLVAEAKLFPAHVRGEVGHELI